jgi:hypothetical protein
MDTVIGTIGKTHGVRLARNPAPNDTAAAMAKPFSAYFVNVPVSEPSAHARLGKSINATKMARVMGARLFTGSPPSERCRDAYPKRRLDDESIASLLGRRILPGEMCR